MNQYYIGIDPSTVSTGYAVLNENGDLVTYGVIRPKEEAPQYQKVHFQYQELKKIMEMYPPSVICSEEQFGGVNKDTLKKLCHVTGIVMLLACETNADYHMKYPASWRKSFHGNGAVKKEDTLKLVNSMFSLHLSKKQHDIADAIGMAVVAYKIGKQDQ